MRNWCRSSWAAGVKSNVLIKLTDGGGPSPEWPVPFSRIWVLNCIQEDKLNSRQKCMRSFLSLLSAVETMWITVFSSRNFDLPAAVGHALEKGGKINSLSPELLCVRVFYHSNGSKAKTLSFFFPYPYDQGREGTTGKMWETLHNTLQLQSLMIIKACSHHACHTP